MASRMMLTIALFSVLAVGIQAQTITPGAWWGSCVQLAGSSYDGSTQFCSPNNQLISQNMYVRYAINGTGTFYSFGLDASVTISIANTTTVFLEGFAEAPSAVTGTIGTASGNSTCLVVGGGALRATFATVAGVPMYIEEGWYYTNNGTAYKTGCPDAGAPLACNSTLFNYRCTLTPYTGNRV